jgi:signal transduction histidine kinase/ligand-binding sensor domain-containing protein
MLPLTLTLVAHAGAPVPWGVDHWTTRDGLPQNSVTDLLQAKDGTVWVTTSGGVARFDGQRFETVHPAHGPWASRFSAVAQTPDGAIWLGTESEGLLRLVGDRSERIGAAQSVLDLAVDATGELWATTDLGVVRGDAMTRVVEGPGHSYLATLPSGALLASGWASPTCLVGACAPLPPAPAGTPQRWSQDRGGRYRVSTPDAAWQQTARGWEEVATIADSQWTMGQQIDWQGQSWWTVHATLLGPDGRWAVSDVTPVRTAHDQVLASLVDSESGLWLGTSGGGLVRFQPREAGHLGWGRSLRDVVAVGNDVWYSDCADAASTGAVPYPPSLVGRCVELWRDGDDVLGLERTKEGVVRVYRVPKGGAPALVDSRPATDLTPVSSANAGPYFAVDDTLFRVPREGGIEAVTTTSALHARTVRVLYGEGPRAWVVLDESRLIELEGAHIRREIDVAGLALVRDVLDRGDRVWASTYGGGLLAIRGSAIERRLTRNNGLCDDFLSRLFDSEDGDIWVNTNRGMARLAESDLERVASGGDDQLTCRLVDSGEANGLRGVRTPDGRLWAPTTEGLTVVDPASIAPQSPPRMLLSDARYDDQPLPDGGSVLGPGTLALRLTGVQFREPRTVSVRYRIVGVSDWVVVPSGSVLRLVDLAPGSYAIEAEARGLSGEWSEPATLTFGRLPFWWERPAVRFGAPALALVVLVAALVLWLRREIQRNRALQAENRDRIRAEQALIAQQEEARRIQAHLEAGRRLEILGRLAGGVAHDFNNLMTVFAVHAELLSKSPDRGVRADARTMLDAAARGKQITRQLLGLGHRQTEGPVEVLDLGEAVAQIMPLLRRLIRDDILLETDLSPGAYVRMDAGLVHQILTNLVLNGRDAITDAGRIEVRVALDGDHVWLSVTDDGSGMSADIARRVLEPYFTTKGAAGTGLGLPTALVAAQEAGGTLEFDSAPGAGTAVRVRLPRAEPPAAMRPAPVTDEGMRGRTVLVVDDQPEVAEVAARLLQSLGCTTLVASDLETALRHLEGRTVDLALLDVTMPVHNGPEVERRLHEVVPTLPVLFMSGHIDGLERRVPTDRLLSKPFSRADLAKHAERVMRAGVRTAAAR